MCVKVLIWISMLWTCPKATQGHVPNSAKNGQFAWSRPSLKFLMKLPITPARERRFISAVKTYLVVVVSCPISFSDPRQHWVCQNYEDPIWCRLSSLENEIYFFEAFFFLIALLGGFSVHKAQKIHQPQKCNIEFCHCTFIGEPSGGQNSFTRVMVK